MKLTRFRGHPILLMGGVHDVENQPVYRPEFRQQMVELVQSDHTRIGLAREFGCTNQSIRNWVAQAAIETGTPLPGKNGLTSAGAQGAHATAASGPAASDRARGPGEGYGLVWRQRREDVEPVFELVMANQTDFSVIKMCRALNVSTSGYYAWRS